MAKSLHSVVTIRSKADPSTDPDFSIPPFAQYGAALLLVVVAAIIALVASRYVPGPGLTLIFVLPVVIAGAWLGWGPSLAATAAGVLVFDFFFTQPYYSLRIEDPAEIWAASLFLITAAIVGAVAWQSRRRAFEARRAAEQAEGLHALAHAIIQGTPEVAHAAAAALGRIFAAPAAVLSQENGHLIVLANWQGAKLSEADMQAAEDAVAQESPMRGQTYPHDRSKFDVWPVNAGGEGRYALAVDFGQSIYERPANADRLLEIVAAYLALGGAPPR
jgi:K+-sensing histidine kinase KdpD